MNVPGANRDRDRETVLKWPRRRRYVALKGCTDPQQAATAGGCSKQKQVGRNSVEHFIIRLDCVWSCVVNYASGYMQPIIPLKILFALLKNKQNKTLQASEQNADGHPSSVVMIKITIGKILI